MPLPLRSRAGVGTMPFCGLCRFHPVSQTRRGGVGGSSHVGATTASLATHHIWLCATPPSPIYIPPLGAHLLKEVENPSYSGSPNKISQHCPEISLPAWFKGLITILEAWKMMIGRDPRMSFSPPPSSKQLVVAAAVLLPNPDARAELFQCHPAVPEG